MAKKKLGRPKKPRIGRPPGSGKKKVRKLKRKIGRRQMQSSQKTENQLQLVLIEKKTLAKLIKRAVARIKK